MLVKTAQAIALLLPRQKVFHPSTVPLHSSQTSSSRRQVEANVSLEVTRAAVPMPPLIHFRRGCYTRAQTKCEANKTRIAHTSFVRAFDAAGNPSSDITC